jgi:two-component system response regulator AtoC
MNTSQLLIIDDEINLNYFLENALKEEGYLVSTAFNLKEGRQLLKSKQPDLILLDIKLPDGLGLEFLSEIRQQGPNIQIILMTAYGSIEQAVHAMKLGADNYLQKPFDIDELKLLIHQLHKQKSIKNELAFLKSKQFESLSDTYYICQSPVMQDLYSLIQKVAKSNDTDVIIEGESGTGKEMLVQMVHNLSPRSKGALVDINCASIPENLMESELFGYEPGAFTGATKRKSGLMEVANNGTFFLDEISELSLQLQVKLLRVLETRMIRSLGGVRDKAVDFRLIAATNRSLSNLVKDGKFREDLYYRLQVFPIKVPALRDHPDDILPLAKYFLQKFSKQANKSGMKLSTSTEKKLMEYSWPGNVREVKNIIERTVVMCDNSEIKAEQILLTPLHLRDPVIPSQLPVDGLNMESVLENIRSEFVQQALTRTHGNQVQAAKLLNVPRHIIRYYLQQKDING